ncbi:MULTISPECIES: nucleoside triphosphate pyrophosphohydrolase family protein [unclassified Caulobacter]|uniref:nucleoside triphosphate pyrophosphohydrolase family protein n=1 Tax=unclassified Caulobacter TaxID=2648921 RepID=UPI0007012E50|nr:MULTISPECIES: nucleoside triphosphate pyrophosphohydrolase family protein [unclassified Caulobacter]KQV57382.1 hypothetical protein ASC62_14090 [Caulobacter sp. Root342]KQV66954.1 hypothetical protein ASC70_14190 [Caulobacter sp. Root343]
MPLSLADIRTELEPSASTPGPIGLDEYQRFAQRTDKTGDNPALSTSLVLLGLFGEVGSLLSEMKKKQKDQNTFRSYADSAHEEMGDVLWYFSAAVTKAGMTLSEIAAGSPKGPSAPRTFVDLQAQTQLFEEPVVGPQAEQRLLTLAVCTGQAINRWSPAGLDQDAEGFRQDLVRVFDALVEAADDAGISLDVAAVRNIDKILDRHPVQENWGERFDADDDEDERLPDLIEMRFKEKRTEKGTRFVIQQWNGVNIGDRLTDNSSSEDYYRYHDVFHLSYAAILGWSPVLRALLRLKRKSKPVVDEHEDGARAVITEEGISNWIFSHGVRRQAFLGANSLDFALLQTIRAMVKGYEVESRPLWMWERAILEGFRVFRALRDNRGGIIVADLKAHTLTYRKDS